MSALQRQDAIRYLEDAGFIYKSAFSPDLWDHIEGEILGKGVLGGRFAPQTCTALERLVAESEDALLNAMVSAHKKTGAIERLMATLDLPYIVGTEAVVPLSGQDDANVLRLVEHAGLPGERLIHVVLSGADAMPCTRRVTIEGGLYADGRTAGLYRLMPGAGVENRFDGNIAYLMTIDEARSLIHEMEARLDDIRNLPREDCLAMLERARAAVGKIYSV